MANRSDSTFNKRFLLAAEQGDVELLRQMLDEVVAKTLARVAKARAADIRRELKQQFRDRFEIDPTNVGGGVWEYAGKHRGHEFALTMDYGGFINFRYGIVTSCLPKRGTPYGVAWEGLLGFSLSGWDCVRPNNLSQSVSLLGEIIEKLVPLLEEIPYEH